jgi:hypothetical protein
MKWVGSYFPTKYLPTTYIWIELFLEQNAIIGFRMRKKILLAILIFLFTATLSRVVVNAQSQPGNNAVLNIEQDFFTSVVATLSSQRAIAFVWPIIFIVFTMIVNISAAGESRGIDRKFRIKYEEGNVEKISQPRISEIKTAITSVGANEIKDVEELAPDFFETSVGVDLSMGAISATLSAGLSAASKQNLETVNAVFIFIFFEIFALLVIRNILKNFSNHPNRVVRVSMKFGVTNIIGLLLSYLSFLVLGNVLK